MPSTKRCLPLVLLLLAGIALRLIFMNISLERLPVTSDEAMVVLQAKQIARGDRPLLFLAQPYQFPLGAYLMSPLVEHTPRTPLGARGISLGLGLASFLGIWLLLGRLTGAAPAWPGLLLVAFPPAYLLLYQAAYPVPQYDYMLALWCLAAWLTLFMKDKPTPSALGLAALLGLVSGLSLSVHPLALSFLAPLVCLASLQGGLRKAPLRAAALLPGLVLGLGPYLAAQWIHPGATAEVAGLRPWAAAFSAPMLPVVNHAMAGVLGAFSTVFPDSHGTTSLGGWLETLLPALFVLLCLGAGGVGLAGLWGRRGDAPPVDKGYLVLFAGAPLLGLFLFQLSERSNSEQYRYLLVLVWCLPFMLALLYAAAGRAWRVPLGALAVLWALINLGTSVTLMAQWTEPEFAFRNASITYLDPVLEYLERNNLIHCFASYGTAYRLTFLSDEKIKCSQPLNERFIDGPVPYKEEVSSDSRAAYVLTSLDSFSADGFAQDIANLGLAYRRTEVGCYQVFEGFTQRQWDWERPVPHARIAVEASHNPILARLLSDGDRTTMWNSGQGQEQGMWLEVRLGRTLPVSRLTLHYHNYPYDQAGALRLSARQDGQWRTIADEVRASLQPCELVNRLPLYGYRQEDLRFPPVWADALRVEIVSPRPDRLWTAAEVEIFYDSRQAGPD